MQQLTGLQQHTSQQHTLRPASQSIVAALQAASMLAQAGEDAMPAQHRSVQGPAPLARTTTNAGAMLRTLSSTNPRVLALAAAAAKAPAGTPEHAAVLSALKDEIMSATNSRTPAAAAATAAADCDEDMQPACCDPRTLATVNPAPAAEPNQQLYQQPALTQDALWAALMAKAAARSGLGGSGPNSPHKQQHQESPKALPGHGSADSALEAEGTSCSLPWALLQAAQQAQQEEEEKEAALAAAAAASAAGAAAMEATYASPSVAAAAAAGDGSSGSPRSSAAARPTSSASTRAANQVVFKRRNTHNSNALQKHFSRPAPLPSGPSGLSRTQSEIPGVPKPQHTFKKQTRKKPLTLHVNSCSNLAALVHPGKQQPQQQQGCVETPLKPAAAAAATEPECSTDTGGTAAAGSLLTHTLLEGSAPSLSGVSLRAPAVTAPAAIGAGGAVTDVLSFLACRGQQLQALQEQLQAHRRRLSTPANAPGHSLSEAADGDAATATAAAAAATSAGPGSPTFSNSLSPALTDLQRMLSSMAATAGARLPAAAAPHMADVEMMDACETPMDSALEQAKRMLAAQREAAAGADAQVQAVSALKAMVAALNPTQQQQLLQQAIARAASANAPVPAPAASASNNADLLRKLAAALHTMQ